MRLEGRLILVTGGASGIGRGTARLFAAEGAAVALIDCNDAGLKEALTELASGGARATSAVADVSVESEVCRAVSECAAALGGLDGLVNAAGADLLRPLVEMDAAEWGRIIDVNLTGPYLVCRAALPALTAAGRATVVNVASGAALRPLENRTAYCAAKAGLVMFGKSLSIELAQHNIRVNSICPGIIDTPMFRASFEGAADPQAEFARIMDRYVIKRVGQTTDIAYAALYLSCDESAYVTGVALAVDGGRTFH